MGQARRRGCLSWRRKFWRSVFGIWRPAAQGKDGGDVSRQSDHRVAADNSFFLDTASAPFRRDISIASGRPPLCKRRIIPRDRQGIYRPRLLASGHGPSAISNRGADQFRVCRHASDQSHGRRENGCDGRYAKGIDEVGLAGTGRYERAPDRPVSPRHASPASLRDGKGGWRSDFQCLDEVFRDADCGCRRSVRFP